MTASMAGASNIGTAAAEIVAELAARFRDPALVILAAEAASRGRVDLDTVRSPLCDPATLPRGPGALHLLAALYAELEHTDARLRGVLERYLELVAKPASGEIGCWFGDCRSGASGIACSLDLAGDTVCHGWAGLLRLFCSFQRGRPSPEFRTAMDLVATRLVERYDPAMFCGFRFHQPLADRYFESPGRLAGAAGVALALHAYTRCAG